MYRVRLFSTTQGQNKGQWVQTGRKEFAYELEEKKYLRMMDYWNTLHREVVESAPLEIFEAQVDTDFSNPL